MARLPVWPQSLFGRLLAASVVAVLLAQAAGLFLIARDRERFILQGTVREWSRRIADITFMLQPLDGPERATAIKRLIEQPPRLKRMIFNGRLLLEQSFSPGNEPEPGPAPQLPPGAPPESAAESLRRGVLVLGGEWGAVQRRAPGEPPAGPPGLPKRGFLEEPSPGVPPGSSQRGFPEDVLLGVVPESRQSGPLLGPPLGIPPEPMRGMLPFESGFVFLPLPLASDFEHTFVQQLQATLGTAYHASVAPATNTSTRAIPVAMPFLEARDGGAQPYDATVRFPDGGTVVFRVSRMPRGAPLPRNLFLNLILLMVIMVVALFVTARSITRPLSRLAHAADSVGRGLRPPKLEENGARELRDAARAFNTMQDRLHRYLDSRTRVLAAMSHDLKTPLTRLRLQVETALDDPAIQCRFGKELDEMESMVRGSLALFRGLDDDEALAPIDVNALLATLQSEFAEMGENMTVEGAAAGVFFGKTQALRRCLTNLIANAIKFGSVATVLVADGNTLVIRVRDAGPGIPAEELERVFEPFYRLESSRNRDTGGTGLGLSIARDVAQAHGGSLIVANLPERGLEAVLTLPHNRRV